MRKAHLVRIALEEANADGDNEALSALTERFDNCTKRMKALAQALDDFRSAVIRTDAEFDEAEHALHSLIGNLEERAELNMGASYQDARNWQPDAYAVMPDMRVHAAPVPEWLRYRLNTAVGTP